MDVEAMRRIVDMIGTFLGLPERSLWIFGCAEVKDERAVTFFDLDSLNTFVVAFENDLDASLSGICTVNVGQLDLVVGASFYQGASTLHNHA
jgi:hypothetical protein